MNILWLWFGFLSIAMLPLLWLLADSFRNPRPRFHKPLNWSKSKAESETDA